MTSQTFVEHGSEQKVRVAAGTFSLAATLGRPEAPRGVVLFAHGSGSGRHSPRNQMVARRLQAAGFATLLVDLLTVEEEAIDRYTFELRFDIGLLTDRLIVATDWLSQDGRTAGLPIGCFGASTGGAAALVAAARRPERVAAVVSRGGRPDLAAETLTEVRAATLLIVGGNDLPVLEGNRQAFARLGAPVKELAIVPGASHLFEERGKLLEVARLAAAWYGRHLATPQAATA